MINKEGDSMKINCKCCNRRITELKEDLGGFCRNCNEYNKEKPVVTNENWKQCIIIEVQPDGLDYFPKGVMESMIMKALNLAEEHFNKQWDDNAVMFRRYQKSRDEEISRLKNKEGEST